MNERADMLDIEAAGLRSQAAALELERQEILLAQVKGGEAQTLRDYFAAHALQGLLANPDESGTWDAQARDAYKYADAMLAARKAVTP